MKSNRRDFLRTSALMGLAGFAGNLLGEEKINIFESVQRLSAEGKIELPPLPYAYDALEPFIDKETMNIHHKKHHKGYIDKLNTADKKDFDPTADPTDSCGKVTEKTPALVRNNLGGYYNHMLFWQLMQPKGTGSNKPEGALAEAINKEFGSFDNFKKEFAGKAAKQFGSGWGWLIKDKNKKLKITSTPNQDNPLMQVAAEQGTPILGVDVWEHAYYLKYQNKRAEYLENWWNVVNWKKVAELYAA